MREERRVIPEFEDYEISNYGEVFNLHNNHIMTWSPTLLGEMSVGLSRNGRQYRRSVKVLVARAFVPGETEIFDTPILLDGSRINLRADNIMWRPRWFSWRYMHQFTEPEDWYHDGPIIELISLREYNTIIEAAIDNGLLCVDIRGSIDYEEATWPTGQNFAFLE